MATTETSPHEAFPDCMSGRQRQLCRGQVFVYGLFAIGMVTTVILQLGQVAIPDGGAPPDPVRGAAGARAINPNNATWVELALLPGLGEVLAKRIVAYREAARADTGEAVAVFTCPEDLDEIRGIGEGKIAQWEGFLVFSDAESGAS